jgi:hypothetical protein
MKTLITLVVVWAGILLELAAIPVEAANLNQIQQQVLQAAQERQEVPSSGSASAATSPRPVSNQPTLATPIPSSSPQIEILWQAYDGKVKLWKLDGQLFLSIKW